MLALIKYMWLAIEVGRARGRFNLPATATTGDENFDRFFPAHQNTTEQLVAFLPFALCLRILCEWHLGSSHRAGLRDASHGVFSRLHRP